MAVRLGIPESVAGVPLARRLAWATGARLGVLCIALGALALVAISRGFGASAASVRLVVATLVVGFGLTVAYSFLLRSGRNLERLANAQLVCDQLIWSALVFLTGGAASGATSFYGLTCLLGAFLTGIRGVALAGFAGLVSYVVLVAAMHRGLLEPPDGQHIGLYNLPSEELLSYVILNALAIAVVTALASYLAERLQTAGGKIVQAEERAERAERMAALGRLAAGLAHEIRNPLGSISGSIQLLRTNPALGVDDRKLCEIIEREAARLNDLVTDMMNVAKPRAPEVVAVDAAALAREVVDLATHSGRGTSDVRVVYQGEDEVVVQADGSQLRQLVWNLVRNAVQASTPGGEVRVRLLTSDGIAALSVEDDGAGIDEASRGRLFDAFFTTRSHGTGIGLAVVKRIADDHGFAIDVDSEEGRGACFRVRLGQRLEQVAPVPTPGRPSTFPPPLTS